MGQRINLAEFVDAGLLNDADVTMEEFRFEIYDYDGKADPATCLKVVMIRDGETEPHNQYFSVGGGVDAFVPSDDGTALESAGDRTALAKRSNYQIFMASLEKCGLEKERYMDDITALNGTRGHVMRVPAQDRGNLPDSGRRRKDNDGTDRKPENLVVTNVTSFPWDKGGKTAGKSTKTAGKATGSAAKATAGKSKAAAAAEADDELEATVAKLVAKILIANNGSMDFDDLAVEVYQTQAKPQRKATQAMLTKEWLAEHEDFEIEDDSVSLA